MAENILRYGILVALVILTAISAVLTATASLLWLWAVVPLLMLIAVGAWDYFQNRHSILRNYPLSGHLRWLFEFLRPYLRQYIVEDDLGGRPFSHNDRDLVYARAKNDVDVLAFGTELDVYSTEYEWLTHSIGSKKNHDPDFRVKVGGPQCSRPYDASLLNISAMSFGSLGAHAVEALNLGAKIGNFYHDTGEGGVSRYHLKHGGDLVWEIGSGYFGCRSADGRFDPARFRDQALDDRIKMIEIKLSQGAKPGHGGVLPAAKVTPEIAAARGVPVGKDCISPPSHSAFTSPTELAAFVASLREMSGGKPVGMKLCVGHPWEIVAICKAAIKTGIYPDYVVVDGAEGGTGAAPEEFANHLGAPLRDGLIFVRNVLVGMEMRDRIRIAASGKLTSAFSIAQNIAFGADWCNSARAFMFSLGCVMSKRCHTGTCPTGVTTHDPSRQRGLVVPDKALRVASFHRNTLHALGELAGAAGLEYPHQLRPHHIHHRISPVEVRTMSEIYPFLEPGALLNDPERTPYADAWQSADPDSWAPKDHAGPVRHIAPA